MFDAGSEQFHQFIASSRTSLPISLPFPLHGSPSFSAAAFDSFAPPLHPSSAAAKNISTNLALESDRSTDPWSNDELLALLKVRSSMELWFPDFTWEHVSRKLGELGFKRSAEQCKDKFEEESRHFNNNKNYRILSELDEFYHPDDQAQAQTQTQTPVSAHEVDQHKAPVSHQMKKVVEEILRDDDAEPEKPRPHDEAVAKKASKKRKRKQKMEMVKGFCEAVVKTMMAKQEELHNKLINDIVKMDAEKIAREEAWKNQEMDRIRTQIEIRSRDNKSAAERQATIIQFLKHFTSDQEQQIFKNQYNNANMNNNSNSNSNSSASFPQTHDHNDVVATPPPPSMICQNNPPPPSSPSSILADHHPPPQPPCLSEGGGDDVGKRWPRDEVMALINLRCKMSGGEQESGGGGGGGKEGARGPLWERISQGMKELGYKRSAKRCKEKWENINKYFRKTKDSSKKRSLNSRTCPYFHQLTSLYSDGTIVAPTTAAPENH